MKVKEIFRDKTSAVITIKPDQSLFDACQLLTQHNIGAVVVMKNDAVVGMLSERDIVRQLAQHQAKSLNLKVQDVMSEHVIVAYMDDDLSHISSTMTERRIRHLPVMDDEKLVGIVSIGDVVKQQLVHVSNEARMLQQYITGG